MKEEGKSGNMTWSICTGNTTQECVAGCGAVISPEPIAARSMEMEIAATQPTTTECRGGESRRRASRKSVMIEDRAGCSLQRW